MENPDTWDDITRLIDRTINEYLEGSLDPSTGGAPVGLSLPASIRAALFMAGFEITPRCPLRPGTYTVEATVGPDDRERRVFRDADGERVWEHGASAGQPLPTDSMVHIALMDNGSGDEIVRGIFASHAAAEAHIREEFLRDCDAFAWADGDGKYRYTRVDPTTGAEETVEIPDIGNPSLEAISHLLPGSGASVEPYVLGTVTYNELHGGWNSGPMENVGDDAADHEDSEEEKERDDD